jgi:hypothetical protein
MLIFCNGVCSRGDLAAHSVSAQKYISESVLGLAGVNERENMCAIFAAVFGVEPVIDAALAVAQQFYNNHVGIIYINGIQTCNEF